MHVKDGINHCSILSARAERDCIRPRNYFFRVIYIRFWVQQLYIDEVTIFLFVAKPQHLIAPQYFNYTRAKSYRWSRCFESIVCFRECCSQSLHKNSRIRRSTIAVLFLFCWCDQQMLTFSASPSSLSYRFWSVVHEQYNSF